MLPPAPSLPAETNPPASCTAADHRVLCCAAQGNLFDAFDLQWAEAPAVEVAWIPVHVDMDLCSEQEVLLKHVAKKHNAYWDVDVNE